VGKLEVVVVCADEVEKVLEREDEMVGVPGRTEVLDEMTEEVVTEEGYSVVLSFPGAKTDLLFPVSPIVPFQIISQDSVLRDFGMWSQKWSCESRTRNPLREALPVLIIPVRKFAAWRLIENACAWSITWMIQLTMENTM
jgi:hypothetical protein